MQDFMFKNGDKVSYVDGDEGVVEFRGGEAGVLWERDRWGSWMGTGGDLTLIEDSNNPIEPNHYQRNGVNFIEFIEHLPGNRFNAMKYIYRAGEKNPDTLLEDLKKGQWSLNREIERLERDDANSRD